jgi:cytidyltransferase-like protein
MFITQLFENAQRRIVVTYPGRFQPFHNGHKEVLENLQSRFGTENVFVVTSNKVDNVKSFFNFSERAQFMMAAGVPSHSIIEAAQVYDLPGQFAAEKSNIVFITALGATDAQRLGTGGTKKDGNPAYFQTLPENADINSLETADKHGYVVIEELKPKTITLNNQTVDVSRGTATRNAWNSIRNDDKLRAEFLTQMYGKNFTNLGQLLDKISTGAPEPVAKPSPKLTKVKPVKQQPVVKANNSVDESMYQYDKQDPYNSEFAPDVGMGRMTLRGWKQSMIRRVKEFAAELERSGQDLDKDAMWDQVHKKLKSLNLDPIAQEIELAHQELDRIRKRGGIRSRAFKQ